MRCCPRIGDFTLNIGARAEAGIEQALVIKVFESLAVCGVMLRLSADGRFPDKAKPTHILVYGLLESRTASALVDVFQAQQEPPISGGLIGKQRRIGMSEV